ncbi:hypothetical protein [Pectobacterium odoriferum]|uniref:hypothetical protein n=1 Tax=Pectobacterium odoriferum TaxID=78398 RepID=UPI000CD23DBF|nr:hypothetical protein [Pectobacterium odoriferum]POD93009.1 hypothetical protein BV925_09520 [Pectobacterium odoriferum]
MTEKNTSISINEWHAAITKRAGSEPEKVISILEELKIRPRPVLPRARTLNLLSIQMMGKKCEKNQETPFSFEWSGLSDGLWALLSEGNFKGKSSTLAVFRAAIQGRFPGKIKLDVWSWIANLKVQFKIDDTSYEIELQKQPTETDENKAKASLVRIIGSIALPLYTGLAGEGLRTALENVFMDELGFDHFHAYRSNKNTVVEHGWTALSSALFVTGPGPAIFGDHTEDGLPLRLIQMFIGLPWVSTYTAISTALKKAKSEYDKTQSDNLADNFKVSERINSLKEEKNKKEFELSQVPDRNYIRKELSSLDYKLSLEQEKVITLRNELNKAQTLVQDSTVAHAEARRMLQQTKDEAAAGYVFRKLQPVCCPACEAKLQPDRFSTHIIQACGLCGNESLQMDGHEVIDFNELEIAVNDSDTARKNAVEALAEAKNDFIKADESRDVTLEQLNKLGDILSGSDDTDRILLEIAGIDGRIEELNSMLVTASPEISQENEIIRVLNSAEIITKKAMEGLQAEIMKEVEKELFDLAERFGVRNLEALSFKAHRMDLRQGGVDVTFSGLNSGENLRIRVAAALATLKVARSRGFGRHPGLLILDSPAASEMSADNFSALIGAVAATVNEIPGIQVIVGAIMRSELEPVVPQERRKIAVGAETLF